MARSELSAAKAEAGRARLKVNQVALAVKRRHQTSAEWKEAATALNRAKAEYAASSRAALAEARAGAEYPSPKARQQQHSRTSLDTVRVAAFNAGGRDVRKANHSLQQFEAEAVASDPNVIAAKRNIEAADARLAQLQAALDAELSTDPRWVAAKQAADSAEQRVNSAQSSYASAVTAEKQQRRDRNALRQSTVARGWSARHSASARMGRSRRTVSS
jgi:hypothetical protein